MIKHQVHLMLSPIEINFESSSLPISQPVFPTCFDAVNFAYRLSKLSTFLPAAYELLSLLYEYKYIITTRKTIRLFELARKTLERAGIIIYSFASCPETFVAYKKVYIDLLKILQANGGQENIELRGRIQILLMPLSSNFSIQKPETGSSICIRSTSLQKHSRTTDPSLCSGQGTRSLDSSESPAVVAAQHATMLPPDAFPAVIHLQSSLPVCNSPIKRPRSPLWDYRQFEKSTSTRKRCLDQENIVTQSEKYRPPKKLRKFGIYCTGKSSMDNLNSFRRSERQTFVL